MQGEASTFDWLRFPQGRARFCGGVRGAEQRGCEAFAIDLGGAERFGEIRKVWQDDDRFNLEVVSFGHQMLENIGIPVSPDSPLVTAYSSAELGTVQVLVQQLVQAFVPRRDRPFVMDMDDERAFLGKVLFADGWALQTDSGTQVQA